MSKSVKLGVAFFGLIEICIGLVTLIAVILSLVLGTSAKPPAVLIFVLATSIISACLGIGILMNNLASYHMLMFFATVVVFSKALIFAKIISLSGDLETNIPSSTKNIISIIYHSILIFYFSSPKVRELFGEKRKVLFSLKIPFLK